MVALSFLPVEPLSWYAPVAREDGTALSLSEIDFYYLYRSDGHITGWKESPTTVYPGYCYRMTTVDMDGRESSFSNNVCK